MRKFLFIFLVISNLSVAATTVTIATNKDQPPFSLSGGAGLVADLVKEMNASQSDYNFVLKTVVAERSKKGLNDGTYDMVAMSNINWGYQGMPVKSSADLLKVQDQFFATQNDAKNQLYFEKVGTKAAKTVVVKGFSYKFLVNNQDKKTLKSRFNTSTVPDEPTVVKMVLSGRADIGVSSSTNLEYYSVTNPEQHSKLLVSDKADSEYMRHFVVADGGKIPLAKFNAILNNLAGNGKLKTIFSKYGLTPAL